MISILTLRNAKEARYQYNTNITPSDVGVHRVEYYETLGGR